MNSNPCYSEAELLTTDEDAARIADLITKGLQKAIKMGWKTHWQASKIMPHENALNGKRSGSDGWVATITVCPHPEE